MVILFLSCCQPCLTANNNTLCKTKLFPTPLFSCIAGHVCSPLIPLSLPRSVTGVVVCIPYRGDGRTNPRDHPPKNSGVFSTRSPHRPNPIGISLGRIESVQGDTVVITGLDIVDGTPILDIKPYIPTYDRPDAEFRVPAWIARTQEPSLDITVVFTPHADEQLTALEDKLELFQTAAQARACIIELLACDPRYSAAQQSVRTRRHYCSVPLALMR